MDEALSVQAHPNQYTRERHAFRLFKIKINIKIKIKLIAHSPVGGNNMSPATSLKMPASMLLLLPSVPDSGLPWEATGADTYHGGCMV